LSPSSIYLPAFFSRKTMYPNLGIHCLTFLNDHISRGNCFTPFPSLPYVCRKRIGEMFSSLSRRFVTDTSISKLSDPQAFFSSSALSFFDILTSCSLKKILLQSLFPKCAQRPSEPRSVHWGPLNLQSEMRTYLIYSRREIFFPFMSPRSRAIPTPLPPHNCAQSTLKTISFRDSSQFPASFFPRTPQRNLSRGRNALILHCSKIPLA